MYVILLIYYFWLCWVFTDAQASVQQGILSSSGVGLLLLRLPGSRAKDQ